jgi:hypothetical protein
LHDVLVPCRREIKLQQFIHSLLAYLHNVKVGHRGVERADADEAHLELQAKNATPKDKTDKALLPWCWCQLEYLVLLLRRIEQN